MGTSFLLISEAGIIRLILIPRLTFHIQPLYDFCYLSLILGVGILLLHMLTWCISHKLYYGFKYAFTHAGLIRKVRKSLKDAGYYTEGIFFNEKVCILPKVKILFDDLSLGSGKVLIENRIKFDKRLEDVSISSALKKYIVQQQYISDDANFYVYEFEDATIDRQLVFNSYSDFCKHAKTVGDYKLFMDNRTVVPLTHLLLAGSTGSGKTYASYSLIHTMLCWEIPANLYICDPKNSSLVVLGNRICPDKTAGTVEAIIELLERFYSEMQNRKQVLSDKLNEKLDADYRYWNLSANVFIIDEYAGFQSSVNCMDKKTKDKVNAMLREIVLQGRQLGCFLWIFMQKTGADELPTQIRSNLIWKVVLGNATRTTYLTAFEESANLPIRNFSVGHGLYHYQGLTREPQLISFPKLNFAILENIQL